MKLAPRSNGIGGRYAPATELIAEAGRRLPQPIVFVEASADPSHGLAEVRWIEEVAPAIEKYANSSASSVVAAIEEARSKKLTGGLANENAVMEFLAKRFTKSQAKAIEAAHLADEGRPIETLWDAVVGATAYARGIGYQDERVQIEREAGKLMAA